MKPKVANLLLPFVIGYIVIFSPFVLFAKIRESQIPFSYIVHYIVFGFFIAVAYLLFRIIYLNSASSPLNSYHIILRVICIWATVTFLIVGFNWFRIKMTLRAKSVLITHIIIRNTMEAIERYFRDFGQIPAEQEGLTVLMLNPKSTNYLYQTELPLDAWGNALRYSVENGEPILWSVGRDGKAGTKDDIVIKGLPPWDDEFEDDHW